MAVAATQISLRELAAETGLHASQISRIQNGGAASSDTMRRLELYFTKRGLKFEQRNGDVGVFAPDPEPSRAEEPKAGQKKIDIALISDLKLGPK